jgi:hypothetical protein
MSAAEVPQVRLPDLSGRSVDPFDLPASAKGLVALFVSAECPVSNRYAPEMIRLHDRFAPQGIAFRIIYPNPAETPEIIVRHLKDFSLPPRALRDPAHAFVKAAGISITPEAAVYDKDKRLVYRGRIDDRYVNIGVERPAPTKRDLEEVVAALAAGIPMSPRTTEAVGCYVADFVPVK